MTSGEIASTEAPVTSGQARSAVQRSALWAAWGDALGFPTELTRDGQDLQGRLGGDEIEVPRAWRRRVGGRFGVEADLPAGAYSDDTQLRLAVARCIRSGGRFDVESFSKIELSVFLSYALGAGRGTRQAATALARRAVRWNSNFFDQQGQVYVRGGGNGAAMRIQPHVWAAADHRAERYLPGLLRDTVSTHGHARGILGAAWHALVLGTSLRERRIPEPDSWAEMAATLARVPARMEADQALHDRWLPTWQREAGESFEASCAAVAEECIALVNTARSLKRSGRLGEQYAALAAAVGGLDPATRGSGTVSSILSLWLAWAADGDAAGALRAAANLRGADTDTVATMTGALLGAVAADDPPGPLQDEELILSDAARLDAIRDGRPVVDFPHPDPLGWQPPKTQADALGISDDGGLLLIALGSCTPIGDPLTGSGKEPGVWQWLRTDYGQTLIVKRRKQLKPLPSASLQRPRPQPTPERVVALPARPQPTAPDSVEDALAAAVASNFDEATIGRLVKHLGGLENGPEKAGIFGALLATELGRRQSRRRS